jgi:hypothetical protein
MAEADGNRTRLTEMLGHYGFEDRARHQTRNASTTIGDHTLGRTADDDATAVTRVGVVRGVCGEGPWVTLSPPRRGAGAVRRWDRGWQGVP